MDSSEPSPALLRCTLFLALALAGSQADARGVTRYRITEIGALGAPLSFATAISDRGLVVGNVRYADGHYQAFAWDATAGIRRVDPAAAESLAYGVNRNGQIVGAVDVGDGLQDAVRWEPDGGRTIVAWAPWGAIATAINERGEIAGYRNEGIYYVTQQAFVWPASDPSSAWTDLFDDRAESFAADINRRGEVVGYEDQRAFVYRPGLGISFLAPDPSRLGPAYAEAVNDRGEVLVNQLGAAFLTTARRVTPVQAPAGAEAIYPQDLGGDGTVVGYAVGASGQRAFLWNRQQGAAYLQALLDGSGQGWTLLSANAVNAGGQIVGHGLKSGRRRAFVLTPVR